ncbi:3-ketodihydrosphingosine reductase TSC10 [Nosema granulosis]|uniref:3-ketodihydrosphingosine reductase TSC10 n=1 Tax=Nosema granulosis TaxID=83296 RepID=A0A9P6H0T3_9MICR|nr:3-ketodihydrosphingosine reductase TSC10 [Nosema granulosis]
MILFLIYFSPLIIAIYSLIDTRKTNKKIYGKKILVIGGSSGLGYSFLRILKKLGNNVTGTSRDMDYIDEKNEDGLYKFIQLDVCKDSTFEKGPTDYDFIFYCTGACIPGDFDDRTAEDHILMTNTNYIGMIKVLKHYSNVNSKPFHFSMVGSTLALFQIPGYSTYTPTKSAILSFFYTTYKEFKRKKIRLHLFNPSNMKTKGFERENRIKDEYNKLLEKFLNTMSPDECAEYFLENMFYRKVVVTDYFTYFCQIRHECEKFVDYLFFPISIVVVFAAKMLCGIFYKIRCFL